MLIGRDAFKLSFPYVSERFQRCDQLIFLKVREVGRAISDRSLLVVPTSHLLSEFFL
jgi:hypothetical protein